jgi:hypothetical protein
MVGVVGVDVIVVAVVVADIVVVGDVATHTPVKRTPASLVHAMPSTTVVPVHTPREHAVAFKQRVCTALHSPSPRSGPAVAQQSRNSCWPACHAVRPGSGPS